MFLLQVLRVNDTFISVLEADRYTVETDGLLIRDGIVRETDLHSSTSESDGTVECKLSTGSNAFQPLKNLNF